jgi:hypothetical protein
LTDIVIVLAVLLGSITAGVMFARPLRSRRTRPSADPASFGRAAQKSPRPLPPMLGGDIFPGERPERPGPPEQPLRPR